MLAVARAASSCYSAAPASCLRSAGLLYRVSKHPFTLNSLSSLHCSVVLFSHPFYRQNASAGWGFVDRYLILIFFDIIFHNLHFSFRTFFFFSWEICREIISSWVPGILSAFHSGAKTKGCSLCAVTAFSPRRTGDKLPPQKQLVLRAHLLPLTWWLTCFTNLPCPDKINRSDTLYTQNRKLREWTQKAEMLV